MFKAVVFDIDDVLISRRAMVAQGRAAVVTRLVENGASSRAAADTWRDVALTLGGIPNLWVFLSVVVQELNMRDRVRVEELADAYAASAGAAVIADAATVRVLTHLRDRGVLLGVASNGDRGGQTKKLEQAGLLTFFDPRFVQIARPSASDAKPSGLMLTTLCSAFCLAAADVLFVGDRPTDVIAARSAGTRSALLVRSSMKTDHVTYQNTRAAAEAAARLSVAKPDFSIESLDQLRQFVR